LKAGLHSPLERSFRLTDDDEPGFSGAGRNSRCIKRLFAVIQYATKASKRFYYHSFALIRFLP
jgi:hypothetical protein